MDRETRLGILANAILDGKPVDWDSVDSTSDASDRAIVRQLQIVAEIAALHRSLPDVDARPSPGPTPSLEETRPAVAWGHLSVLEQVGHGSCGEVYRAWDTQLDREVALKLLRAPDTSGDPSLSLSDPSRVVHEGRLLARVRHPHVITVHGAERREGRVGIWMEFIRGRTLHQIVEQGPLGAREAATAGVDRCQALAAVHHAGLLHRDVTARNVMREDGGRFVLMDFGAGHEYEHAASKDRGADVTGTPLYMAPELFAGGRADQRTDIYALGVLLYYLVTGRYPVTGRSLEEIRAKHGLGERTRLRDVRADLPGPFVQAVEKATAADLSERCQTAGDVEAMLEAALLGTREPARDRAAHVPWRALALVAAVAGGLMVAASIWKSQTAPALQLQARDWILVGAFENRTGEPALDGVGEAALERQLSNSPFVNVVPRARVDDALRLMKRPLESRLDLLTAREISVRDGAIRAFIQGRVEKFGSSYVLAAGVFVTPDGRQISSVEERASDPPALPDAFRRLSDRVRAEIGESPDQIERTSQHLERVTTPSLAALELYSRSYHLGNRTRWDAARDLARQAVERDPRFAVAHIWLAWCLRNTRAPAAEVEAAAVRALQLSGETWGWERLWIQGSYHSIRRDPERAVSAYRALIDIYPDHEWATGNLSRELVQLGRVSEAAPYAARASDLRPNYLFYAESAMRILAESGDWKSAYRYRSRSIEIARSEGIPLTPTAFALPIEEAWRTRQLRAAASALHQLVSDAAAMPSQERPNLAPTLCAWALTLGRPRDAARAAALFDNSDDRSAFLALAAFESGDDQTLKKQLANVVDLNALVNGIGFGLFELVLAAGWSDQRAEEVARLMEKRNQAAAAKLARASISL